MDSWLQLSTLFECHLMYSRDAANHDKPWRRNKVLRFVRCASKPLPRHQTRVNTVAGTTCLIWSNALPIYSFRLRIILMKAAAPGSDEGAANVEAADVRAASLFIRCPRNNCLACVSLAILGVVKNNKPAVSSSANWHHSNTISNAKKQ